jgi:hypothetical protein
VQVSPASSHVLRITSNTRTTNLTSDVSHPSPEAFTSTQARASGRFSLLALEDTLDWLFGKAEPFLGCYLVNSGLDRCEGGQGLVQFCHRLHSKQEYAIKCALDGRQRVKSDSMPRLLELLLACLIWLVPMMCTGRAR